MPRSSSLGESGGVRRMKARWVITAEIRLKTACLLGGESDGTADMTVLRDSKEGVPLLSGTSLAGALRSHLADVLSGYRSAEPLEVAKLFGAARGDDMGSQSLLIFFDAFGKLPEGKMLEIRDGVAIDPAWGTAEAHKKFDFEVLPAGTLFPLRVELIVPESDQESPLLSLLVAAMEGLTHGDISLGMRRSRGLGAITACRWKALRYDLTTPEGWLAWLTSDHETPIPNDARGYDSAAEAIRAAFPLLKFASFPDKRQRLIVDLEMEPARDLLVRSPATEPSAPDVVHLHSAGRPVLPGTSFTGALRAQALRIARLVREAHGDGDAWVERLFGPLLEGEHLEALDTAKPQAMASKVRITESFIENSRERQQTRIAIDRFTGGVVQGALFEEQVQEGGQLRIRMELREPTDAETGFLLLILKDLLSGEIPVGGAVSVGRGVLRGTARVRLSDGTHCTVAQNLSVNEGTLKLFDEKIEAFHKAPSLMAKEV